MQIKTFYTYMHKKTCRFGGKPFRRGFGAFLSAILIPTPQNQMLPPKQPILLNVCVSVHCVFCSIDLVSNLFAPFSVLGLFQQLSPPSAICNVKMSPRCTTTSRTLADNAAAVTCTSRV